MKFQSMADWSLCFETVEKHHVMAWTVGVINCYAPSVKLIKVKRNGQGAKRSSKATLIIT